MKRMVLALIVFGVLGVACGQQVVVRETQAECGNGTIDGEEVCGLSDFDAHQSPRGRLGGAAGRTHRAEGYPREVGALVCADVVDARDLDF